MAHDIIVNSAHAESRYTCLAFSRDGSKIYTGGAEGYVRIWRTDMGDTQEPDVATEGQDGINSLSTSSECWLSGSSDSCVRVYDTDKSTMRGLVTRTVAVPVRCVAIDPKGHRVAVASDELEIKVIDLTSTTNIQKLEGHQKGVRKITWHPSGTILTSSGCDGEVIVWDMPGMGEGQRVKTISGLLPTTDPDSEEYVYDCSCVWHPSGQYFFIATRAHEIVTISKDTWQKSLTFSSDAVTGIVTALAVSNNGIYLASATVSGVFIWSTMTRKILFQYTPETSFSLATHLSFSPNENLLAWTDADANLIRWSKPVPPSFPDPAKSNLSIANFQTPVTMDKTDILKFVSEPTHKVTKENQVDDYEMDDDWMIDDIGLLDHPDKEPNPEQPYTKEMVSVTKAQPAFQPSSTPMINKKRYLAYNMIGVIEITDQDTHNVVNIEFHDRSSRISTHFQDYNKCHMASLGERGALYACPEEGEHPAQIMYKPYSAWGSSGEWDYSLPTGETVLALAAGGSLPSKSLRRKAPDGDVEGNGNVIVATNRGYIRFFSGGGVQRYVWNLAVDVVSMTAGREWVFIVHRDGGTSLDGCQNLCYSLVGFETFNIVQTGRLPIPRGATLKWIGISEEGVPAIYDSNGLLSILDRFRRPTQGRWIPLLETASLARRQGKDESYWPIGVSGSLFMCIILKGKEEYPGFPRPLIQELEVQIPIYSLDEPSGQAEEKIIREQVHIDFIQDALGTDDDISRRILNLDKELIQLIQLACKKDKLQRALDLVSLLHNISSFDLAMKVADFYHLPGLESKIQTMQQERARKENVDDIYEEDIFSKELAPIPAPRKAQTHFVRLHSESFTTSTTLRNSLAPAIPIAPTSLAADTNSIPFDTLDTSDSLPSVWDTSIDGTQETDRKRKDFEAPDSQEQNASKRRLLSAAEPTLNKAAANPFAKKNRNNPFAQSGLKPHETTRSNSFFDKIDDSQNKNTTMKAKQKNASRQTTLYDLPSGSSIEKKPRPKTKPKDTVVDDDQTPETMPSVQPVDELQGSVTMDTAPASPIADPDDEIEWPESPLRIPQGLNTDLAVN